MGEHRSTPNGPIGPDERDYDVGYGKPPTATQFKPGQSGNPAGRPRKPPSLRESLSKALCKEIQVTTRDGVETMSMMEVVSAALVNSAAKGGIGSTRTLTALINELEIGEQDRFDDMTAEDQADFDKLMAVLRGPGK